MRKLWICFSIQRCSKISKSRKKRSYFVYSDVVTGYDPYTIGAIASENETVEQLGLELENKEKDTKMDSKAPKYYYPIVEDARKMDYNKKNEDRHDETGHYS